jgi:hypothetical protein
MDGVGVKDIGTQTRVSRSLVGWVAIRGLVPWLVTRALAGWLVIRSGVGVLVRQAAISGAGTITPRIGLKAEEVKEGPAGGDVTPARRLVRAGQPVNRRQLIGPARSVRSA